MTKSEEGRNRAELERVIRQVRSRWRLRHLLRGVLLTGAALAAALLVVAYGVERWGRSPAGAMALTIVLYAGVAGVGLWTLLRPLLRRVSDRQVALYLEEHEPELKAQLLTAVEGLEARDAPGDRSFLDALIRSAIARAREVEGGRRVDREALRKLSWTAAGAAGVVALLLLVDAAGFRTSLPTLARPWTAVEAAVTRTVRLLPGDTTVARGSELRFSAVPSGFDSERMELAIRSEDGTSWERWPMALAEEDGAHEFLLFRVEEPLEYFAEAEGVRSPIHRVDVVDLPYVSRLELQIEPPSYTGLPVESVEEGGDLAVLPGTTVRVVAHPTVPVAGGRIVIEGTDDVELSTAEESGGLVGEFRVDQPGFYRVDLAGRDGETHRGTPDHVIDLLDDLPPSVSFAEPGRDTRVTSVEEVYVETRATDDHGIAELDLVYSVNGAEEQTVPLLAASSRSLGEVSVGHTFFLEELDLEAGDLVAYHARARDGRPAGEGGETRTDLFFIQIRPFSQEFTQAEEGPSGGMQGGGQGEEGMSGQLSRRQREVVTATFNVERDREAYGAEELEENLATIALAQERLRDEVETLARRLVERGITSTDPEMQQVAEELPQAAEAMGEALEELEAGRTSEALTPEQRALQHLLRAEAAFREIQLQWSPQQQGGTRTDPGEDLADFFDLELDGLRNQYEALQRGEREEMDRELAESMDRLRELARRQQQENERLRRAAEQRPQGTAATGESQRRLAEETEEAARQLERLARERSSPELRDSARRLREAAEAMRRSAASRDERGLAEAEEAREALEEARRLMDRSRDVRLEQDAQAAAERAQRAFERQQRIRNQVWELPGNPIDRREFAGPILDEKDALRDEMDGLESELRRLAREASGEDGEAARRLSEAAEGIRDGRIADRIDYSRSLVDRGPQMQTRQFEDDLTERLRDLRDQVEDAAAAVSEREQDPRDELEERTRDLLRGARSMQERARRAGESGEAGEGGDTPDGESAPDEEAVRQLRREAEERARQTEELGRALSEAGVDVGDLDSVARSFRSLTARDPYGDPEGLAELQRDLVEQIQELDFLVRRELAGVEHEAPAVEGTGDVPEAYRSLVEEYFRSLARPQR